MEHLSKHNLILKLKVLKNAVFDYTTYCDNKKLEVEL